ncbi:hypothetical protein Tco_0933660 [Tanacetum coccineum]
MPISAGITALVLYVSENGVSPLLDLIMVRCAYKTCGISSIQSLLFSSSRTFIPTPKLLFALSTKLLACGCLTEAKSFWERADYVNTPLVERPWRRDGSQFLLWVSQHGAVNLAILTFPYHLSCIRMHCWPVVSLPYGLCYHRSCPIMHTARPFMEFS